MNVVTVGGAVLGLCLLGYRLTLWWPGLKGLKVAHVMQLLPFVYAFAYGVLGILCVGGIIGAAFDFVLWGSNWLGDAAFVVGVGGPMGHEVTVPVTTPLTVGGCAMFLVCTAVFAALMKKKKQLRSDLKLGAWAGCTLGMTKLVALVAAPALASAANLAGAWISTQVIT